MVSSAPEFPMSTPNVDKSQKSPWSDIFATPDKNDDSLWSDYLEKADLFDKRLVNDWNQIVDVILVYVALFIGILNSFITVTSTNFKPDPADITNELLNATYYLIAAQANNISIPIIDTASFYTLNEIDSYRALISNALLYTALALSTVVSVIALAAKLWLVSYSDRTSNLIGLPYDRAVKRQEAYNGVLAWKMGPVINTLPLILLIAVVMFGFFVHISASALEPEIGYAVAIVITLGFVSLAMTSLAAAFVPECPFYSPFSAFIQLVFKYPGKFLEKRFNIPPKSDVNLWLSILLCIVSGAAIAYGSLEYSINVFALVFIPLAITFEYAMQEPKEKYDRKPQKYRLPHFALGGFVVIGSILCAAGYFTYSPKTFIILYSVGMSLLFLFGMAARPLAKSTKKTRDIDAIAWLLNFESAPSEIMLLLKRIGQLTRDDDKHYHYRARLLESLMPLLSSLITSPRTKMEYDNSKLEDLETYVSCLAQLSRFDDDCLWSWKFWRKSWESWRLVREDAKQHPILEPFLIKKLVALIEDKSIEDEFSINPKEAAKVVLRNYGMDEHGEKLPVEDCQQQQVSGNASSKTRFTDPYDKA